MKRETHKIDVKDKVLGRIAVEISLILRGKNKPSFAHNKDEGDFVVVKNIDKMKITGKKFKDKVYYRHSGYPGGFKQETMQELVAKKGFEEVLRKAISGMIPKNKLRARMMKRLSFAK